MAVERIQITSLQAPPDGWQWSSEETARLRRERTREKVFHVGISGDGPRGDAASTADLPSFPSDAASLPKHCGPCGSRYLHHEPPMGAHRRGMVSCGRCGRQVCWLTAPLTPLLSRPAAPSPVREPRRIGSLPARQAVMSRFQWLDGCSRACSVLYGHDAASHEAYGREQARAESVVLQPLGLVQAGPLVVDCDDYRASVDGEVVALSAIEIKVLIHLASHIGMARSHRQIVEAVWDGPTAANMGLLTAAHGQWHGLRVHIARLRGKLGAAGRLIENRHGVGYVLVAEPPVDLEGDHANP